jgi:type I restriction enzyme, S subunit
LAEQWQRVPLEDVLEPVCRREPVLSDRTYEILGAHWYAKGLYTKDIRPGGAIRAKHVYKVAAGDFVYNRLFAWKGSFALASSENDGRYVSNEFLCYRLDAQQVDPRFLLYYFSRQQSWSEALGLSTGSTPTSRNRLKENQFLGMRIPLPPLARQSELVAMADEILGRLAGAGELCGKVSAEADALCRALLHDGTYGAAVDTAMGEVVRLRGADVVVEPSQVYQFAGVYSFGRGVFPGPRKAGQDFAYKRLTRLNAGNFVFPKLMAWEGALGVVPVDCDGLMVSPEFPVFELDESRVLPETLDVYFRSPGVWPALAGVSTGTNLRRRRLHPREFLKFRMALPSLAAQRRLRDVRRRVMDAEATRACAQEEMKALASSAIEAVFGPTSRERAATELQTA